MMMTFRVLIGNLLYFVSGITRTTQEFPVTIPWTFPIISTYTTIYFLSHGNPVTSKESISRECRLPGYLYKGTTNVTKSGLTCQRWDTQSPHEQNYYVFSLAQENYCRNFDREEPWCYTSNSSVRWELCAVDICRSPCLNQSFYTPQIKSQCLSAEPAGDQFCSWMWSIVECLKSRIENSSGIPCSAIKTKSIALQNQNTIERLIGRSISQCIKSPCTGSRVTSFQGLAKYANPCNIQYPIDRESLDTQCPNFLRVANCLLSKIGDETNETCVAKDKISTARTFSSLIPQDAANVSLCISKMSEFPVAASDEDLPNAGQILDTNVNQTPMFVGIGLAVVVIFVGILIVSLITMRKMLLKKRRKELLRLPSIPKTQKSPYEANCTSPVDTYIDPDYEMIEEQDEGYQQLGEQRGGSYVDPNNADGTYLDVVPTSDEKSDASYINVSPYIELRDDSTESTSITKIIDKVREPKENSASSENMTPS